MLGSPRRLAPLVALGRSDRERRQTGPRGRTAVRTRREGHDDRVSVGLVSDTHLPRFGAALPRALERGLRRAGVTRILHLGDMTDPLVVPLFESIAPFDAVAGNNDGAAIRERFGRRKIVQIEDVRVGMIHGDGKRGTTRARALAALAAGDGPMAVPEQDDVGLAVRERGEADV